MWKHLHVLCHVEALHHLCKVWLQDHLGDQRRVCLLDDHNQRIL